MNNFEGAKHLPPNFYSYVAIYACIQRHVI
jgi:hypothetical protein